MSRYVLDLGEIDRTRATAVGGKGAGLAELSRIDGIGVPAGFCVTTDAFARAMSTVPWVDDQLSRLSRMWPDDQAAIRLLSAEVRRTIEQVTIPGDLTAVIARSLAVHGAPAAYAVRSSATAEDLPTASFAGQQDTYLNVVGLTAVLAHISRCWASLFTERAVTYRLQSGFEHRQLRMAVVVQRMVFPQAAGVLFTADPVTGNRKIALVEACFGLGEAFVSGLVNADVYRVRDGEVVAKTIATKRRALQALPSGGTGERSIEPERQRQPTLTDAQVVQLVRLGRRIEAHFGRPQDIEWCLVDDGFQFVQSRPITTLFPVPEPQDADSHVYISVGHQQMMTDAMRPLGLSLWQLTARRPMYAAGGRLFVDISRELASPAKRAVLVAMWRQGDPLIGDALQTVVDRGFIPTLADEDSAAAPAGGAAAPAPIEADPALVDELIKRSQASIAALKGNIAALTGAELLDFILADIDEMQRILFDPRSTQVFMTAMDASAWLNEHMREWLGETNAADMLTQSVPNNITSQMGLALLDVADAIRPHPEVVTFLARVTDESFLDELLALVGGREARDAIQGFLDTYGMRCAGEIDITRPRWSERPTTLLPIILGNVANFEPGAANRRFEQGQREAAARQRDLLGRLQTLPDGETKAGQTEQMIDRVRTFTGYREYPKYGIVSRYFVYKQALLAEAERLVRAGVIGVQDEIFYLTVAELREVVRTACADAQLIAERKEAFRSYQSRTPPRVLTSDGETITGTYHREGLPVGAMAGLPVSAGTVEGRARVVLDMAHADLDTGDILVTTFTDPSWTPLFVTIKGLVTEVGGVMTHGAVIAREYGLPAVVGVEHATQLIQNGQRIRVHGTDGYVEKLE
ncbi:MAG: phosphoenolpyruvate synthase [Actinomycetota bacterium]|nr:phosphoenolpyruvate synthase [Actinomycetota bacterium]